MAVVDVTSLLPTSLKIKSVQTQEKVCDGITSVNHTEKLESLPLRENVLPFDAENINATSLKNV